VSRMNDLVGALNDLTTVKRLNDLNAMCKR
jgi:hypothetical protein